MNKKIAILFSSLLVAGFVLAQEQSSSSAAAPATTTTTVTESAAPAATAAAATATTETAAPAAAPAASCEAKEKGTCMPQSKCAKTHMKKCCHDVLTPQERHHFCEVKCKVVEANPSLKDRKKKHELCDAILKEDPSLKPVLDKLKKHCELEHQKKKAESTSSASTSATK